MEEFLYGMKAFCELLLPILGTIAIFVLILVLLQLKKLLDTTNTTIIKTQTSIDLVEKTLDKVQEPVDTVVKVAKTVDELHDSSLKAAGEAKEFIVTNIENIKNKLVKTNNTNDAENIEEGE